ncbi:hypothetical protein GAPWK_0737 [Gilliamella apicola]|nr:hypothetical protein GAPWK_0737 [Gilliamella apicola]
MYPYVVINSTPLRISADLVSLPFFVLPFFGNIDAEID